MKKVKIVNRSEKNVGVWTPEGKSPLYKFKYTFDDGVEVTAQHQKDEPKFAIGDEVEYNITRENQYGKLASVSKPKPAFGGGGGSKYNSVGATVGAALNNAVSMFIHDKIEKGQIPAVADWLVGEAKKLEKKYGG